MSKHDDIPSTDSAEIEALIDRLKRGTLDQQDTQLIERLLRTLLQWSRGCLETEIIKSQW